MKHFPVRSRNHLFGKYMADGKKMQNNGNSLIFCKGTGANLFAAEVDFQKSYYHHLNSK